MKTTTFGQVLSNFVALTKQNPPTPQAENPVWTPEQYVATLG